eukprot:CAMPEP_0118638542 /NCGR_PEP_ID=MMETSP0785-20121206/3744_1 /TAXON_ID=91992 /ORGANISM="Bolidomonas pacifica, Strain CCMP 1866" /LENGTH=683 /DNA_ID=CAMNT_0006529807 /DNA_START=188 /DNA_END=2236 /DNA_ORIENTATION=+
MSYNRCIVLICFYGCFYGCIYGCIYGMIGRRDLLIEALPTDLQRQQRQQRQHHHHHQHHQQQQDTCKQDTSQQANNNPIENPIVRENRKLGNPSTEWDVNGPGDPRLQGFSTSTSYPPNVPVEFKIQNLHSLPYTISIYRLGYYQSKGARLITTIKPTNYTRQSPCKPLDSGLTVDCGNWFVNAVWEPPADDEDKLKSTRTTGVHIARLETVSEYCSPAPSHGVVPNRTDIGSVLVDKPNMQGRTDKYDYDKGGESYWDTHAYGMSGIGYHTGRLSNPCASLVYFVINPPSSSSSSTILSPSVAVITSEQTWNAYNCYGGLNTYGHECKGESGGRRKMHEGERSHVASFNRPLVTRGYRSVNSFLGTEYSTVRWLERMGYNVGYYSGQDIGRMGREGEELKGYDVMVSNGHDEYWSIDQRRLVESFRDGGGNIWFNSCNEVFWRVGYVPGTNGRVMTSYKDTHELTLINEQDEWTGTFRDGRLINREGPMPENELTGVLFMVNAWVNEPLIVGGEMGGHRLWRHTEVERGRKEVRYMPGILGHELDVDVNNGYRPPGLSKLSKTKCEHCQVLVDEGSTFATGTFMHSVTVYKAVKRQGLEGGVVVGMGTCQWGWGLDGFHDVGGKELGNNCYSLRITMDNFRPDGERDIRQFTYNMLTDMGCKAETPMEDLTLTEPQKDSLQP